MLFLFSLILWQFFKIQILEQDKWKKKANAQHQFSINEPFKRGVFYSNTSIKLGHPQTPQPFVIDVPKFHLYIDPSVISDKFRNDVVKHITLVLQLDKEEQAKVKQEFEKKTHSRRLRKWLSISQKDQIYNWWLGFARKNKIARNALFFVQDYQRSYPFGKLLGQVLHTIREDKDEKTQKGIPTGGLELIFDSFLQGKPGKKLVLRSPRHEMEAGKVLAPAEHGADIYLTINHTLQAIAEEEIEKAVVQAHAKGGWALMMEPRSGEILALAQYPYFDPSNYASYFNDPEKLEDTKVKAVTDPFEPGSTMKAITIAVCFLANEELKKRGERPLFSPSEKIATLPTPLPGRDKPIKDVATHRFLNMHMAMQKSSNVYMAKMIQRVIERLGANWYRHILQDVFGLGIKTNIELPSESAGMLPIPGKLHPNGTLEWSGPTPYSLAMGHNVLVNSIQLAKSYAIIANGGYDVAPTLVRKIVKKYADGSQEILVDNTRSERLNGFKRLIDPYILKEVITGMKYVTKTGGIAFRADIPGYTECGKTGSAEKIINGVYSKKNHISTFIGFAPVSSPRFVLMVVIDEPQFGYVAGRGGNQYGGVCAAPAFKEIGQRALEYLGVTPDDPDQKDWTKEAQSLKLLYDAWNK